MVESTALEMRRTRKGIVGSNPTLSANSLLRNKMMARCRVENPQETRRLGDADRLPFDL